METGRIAQYNGWQNNDAQQTVDLYVTGVNAYRVDKESPLRYLRGKLAPLLVATLIIWLSALVVWVAVDEVFVSGAGALLALLATVTIWSLWALNEYGINVDGTPQEKVKHVTESDDDARLGLLLTLLTPDERDALRSRLVDDLGVDGESVSLADLLAQQEANSTYSDNATP